MLENRMLKPGHLSTFLLLATWFAFISHDARSESGQQLAAGSASTSVPECRLVATPDMVNQTAQHALNMMRQILGGQSIDVPLDPDIKIDVVLVDDALESEVDNNGCRRSPERAINVDTLLHLPIERISKDTSNPDKLTVPGICQARHSQIRCSATAIELILAKDQSSTFSPTLLYVLGHEIAHIALGHTVGAMAADQQPASQSSRLSAALEACMEETRVYDREVAADELALNVLKQTLSDYSVNTDQTFDGFRALYTWFIYTPGMPGAPVERGKTFCHYLRSGAGVWGLPSYLGGHPRWAARLARIAKYTGVIGASTLEQSAILDNRWVERFCRQAREFEAGRLDCDVAGRNDPVLFIGDGVIAKSYTKEPQADAIEADTRFKGLVSADLLEDVCTDTSETCVQLRSMLGKCRSGDGSSCYDLGRQLSSKFHLRHKAAQAMGYGCDLNSAEACLMLATLYKVGALDAEANMLFGGKPDVMSARKYFSRACAIGDPLGCFELAVLYYEQLNLPRIYTLALVSRGCDGGVPLACQRAKEFTESLDSLRSATGLRFPITPLSKISLR